MINWQERLTGFYSEQELLTLKNKTVFVPGCGAIGSYAINILARTGVGNFIIADFDTYQNVNLPGQLFCNTNSIDKPKTITTDQWIKGINPHCNVAIYGKEWTQPENLKAILTQSDVAVLGFDTLSPGILMYRSAREYNLAIVDFYYSTLLSAFLTLPGEPTPEERFHYPTLEKEWHESESPEIAGNSLINLSAFVLSNIPWIMDDFPKEMIKKFLSLGKIPVLPALVSMAGTAMADAAIEHLFGRRRHINYKGFFFDWRRGIHLLPKDPIENEYHYTNARINLLALFNK
jgi:molybdopterin/thiamine biosynthesis adenylyltransferase